MRRALGVAVAAMLVGYASPATAFVRSTTVANQPGQGLCLYWNTRQVTYKVNATSATAPPCQDAAAARALTVASFPAWTPGCTDFHYVDGGTTSQTALANDGENRVLFRSGSCPDKGCTGNACATANNCWDHGTTGTIALTTATFVVSTGELVDADMEVNGWNGSSTAQGARGFYLTCATPSSPTCATPPYGRTGCNYIDVGNVVTHEAGHMLGLDHTCTYPAPYNSCPAGGATMDPTEPVGETSKRVLSADDRNGVCTIYPLGAATATCVSAAPPDGSPGGCSTGGGGTGAVGLIGLALLALRRR